MIKRLDVISLYGSSYLSARTPTLVERISGWFGKPKEDRTLPKGLTQLTKEPPVITYNQRIDDVVRDPNNPAYDFNKVHPGFNRRRCPELTEPEKDYLWKKGFVIIYSAEAAKEMGLDLPEIAEKPEHREFLGKFADHTAVDQPFSAEVKCPDNQTSYQLSDSLGYAAFHIARLVEIDALTFAGILNQQGGRIPIEVRGKYCWEDVLKVLKQHYPLTVEYVEKKVGYFKK